MRKSIFASNSRSLSPTSRQRRDGVRSTAATTRKFSLVQMIIILVFAVFVVQFLVSWRLLGNVSSSMSSSSLSSSSSLYSNSYSSSKYPSWRTMKHEVPSQIDGTFNGAPLQLMTLAKPASRIHCVGDNYQYDGTDWLQRSCHFHFFCFNTTSRRYVIFQSTPEQSLNKILMHTPYFHVSSIMSAAPNVSQAVAIGGINQKWGGSNIPRLRWFPDIINVTNTTPPVRFYALPTSVVLLPYHSLNGANPGHAVWDDFMSLYTLLDMFDLLEFEPLLMRYILDDGQRGMWASCDFRDDKVKACAKILTKFSPMMMGVQNGYKFSTTQSFEFQPAASSSSSQQSPPTDLVCAAHGAAGLGPLTDHGLIKSHGWEAADYYTTHNHGRGGLMRRFRQHVMENLGLGHLATVPREDPHRVVFSQKSSNIPARNLEMGDEIKLLQEGLPNAKVEPYIFKDMTVKEQLQIAGETAVYITPCGGGAVTGMFLPKGASIIIYYQHNGGVQHNRGTGLPAMLDWDLFSAMSHLRVHWFPMAARKDYVGQAGLLFLVRHELFLIESLPVS